MKTKYTLPLLLVLLIVGCKSNSQNYNNSATIYDGETNIAVPDYQRKHLGFDSIQLIVEDDGKIRANFCYPNNWLFAKDTVYTKDTAYRKYSWGMSIAPNVMLMFKEGSVIKGVNVYYGVSTILDDSLKITIQKIKK